MLHITEAFLENILGLQKPKTLLIQDQHPLTIEPIFDHKPKYSSQPKQWVNLVFSDCLTEMLEISMSNIPRKEEHEFIKWKLHVEYGIDQQRFHIGYKRNNENTYIWFIDKHLITAVYNYLEKENFSLYKIYNQSGFLLTKLLKREKRYTGLLVLVCNNCWTISAVKNNEIILLRSFSTQNPFNDESDIMEDLNDTFNHYNYHRNQIKAFYHLSDTDIPDKFLDLKWINAERYYD